MKTILKIEELFMFLAALFLFSRLNFDWWIFPALLLLPDISMLGYLVNNRIGAYIYNFFHHKAVAILVFFAGFYLKAEILQLAAIIIFAHASMDRIFGYGLKYITGFKHTHLGEIGKDKISVEA